MAESPRIVVAGDACIDWLSVPLEPLPDSEQNPPQNWQLRGGRRMYARHGGAWLTARFTEAVVAGEATVCGPQRFAQAELDAISPDRLIHSLLTLDRCRREPNGKQSVLRVVSYEGFAGPGSLEDLEAIPLAPEDPAEADVIVLDDAGNGFRDRESSWPRALRGEGSPVVLHKLRRPLDGGRLGRFLRESEAASRTIVMLNVEELRAESNNSISRGLSWERTATEVVEALCRPGPRPQKGSRHRGRDLTALLDFAHLVIPLGLEGVLYVEGGSDRAGKEAVLCYLPDRIEGDIVSESAGSMTGFASAFAAALAARLARAEAGQRLDRKTIDGGVHDGMQATWRLLRAGFGPCRENEPPPEPDFPAEATCDTNAEGEFDIACARLNPFPVRTDPGNLSNVDAGKREQEVVRRFQRDLAQFRAWSILETEREAPFAVLAQDVVSRGFSQALPHVPVARFGALELIDRREIESYQTVRNLIRQFLQNERPERPLCLAVFGAPGSGKSFGVVQVAKALARTQAEEIEKYTFNVSQWQSPDDLAHALHRVRDSALRGNVPLVFFDEFDSKYGGELGWLKYFLAPMQDGVFNDEAFTHVIGRAIFVFAGGTSTSFAEFQEKAFSDDVNVKDAKARDFLSRLRGYVDVQGVGSPAGVGGPAGSQLVRRAILLRSFLGRKCPGAVEPETGRVRTSPAVAQAFLNVARYQHGIRSIEAILDMSALDGATEVTASLLPPAAQLEPHAPADQFVRLLAVDLDLGEHVEQLAQRAHETFRRGQDGKRDPKHPTMQPWDELLPLYKNSNREQASHIPVKLAAIGCVVQENAAPGTFAFTEEEVDHLARMEHDRWMEERRTAEPLHASRTSWDDLSDDDKAKDREAVRAMPEHLRQVGLQIVRWA